VPTLPTILDDKVVRHLTRHYREESEEDVVVLSLGCVLIESGETLASRLTDGETRRER